MSDPIYEAQAYEIAKMARSISALEAENAKLVDVLHEVEAEAVYAYHCLQQDCVTTANSTEHFFKKWWHAECELDRLKAENTKLRKLVRGLWFAAQYLGMNPDGATGSGFARQMRELGVEAK